MNTATFIKDLILFKQFAGGGGGGGLNKPILQNFTTSHNLIAADYNKILVSGVPASGGASLNFNLESAATLGTNFIFQVCNGTPPTESEESTLLLNPTGGAKINNLEYMLLTYGRSAFFISDGTNWILLNLTGEPGIYTPVDTTVAGDFYGNIIRSISGTAKNITIPSDANLFWPLGGTFGILQSGAGQVTVVPGEIEPGVNVTLDSADNAYTTRVPNSVIYCKKIRANTWLITEDATV